MSETPIDDLPRVRAPELEGGAWLNTARPLSLAGELRGKVVLLDFWTYCCINCQHVLADLKRLERAHAPYLVVVGVHSAKFPNERDADNVRKAILRHDIEHPVVCDPDRRLWDAYAVRAWPTFVLIDPEGYVIGQGSGEGLYEEIDRAVSDCAGEFRERGLLDPHPIELRLERSREGARALSFPGKVLVDLESNRLLVADSGNHRIVVATTAGEVLAVAGDGQPGADDGPFATARFRSPQGMALARGDLYLADTENHLVRRLDLDRQVVETVAGTGLQAREPNQPGVGREVALNSPWDLAPLEGRSEQGAASRPFLFIAMAGAHQVWLLDLEIGHCFPFAGTGDEGIADGHRGEAWLAQPSGLGLHRRWLFVADSEVSALRCVDLEQESVSTVVGQGLFAFGDADGPWEQARFQHPLGVAVDGPLAYVADTYNHRIKAVHLTEGWVKTVAGDGRAGLEDGQPGRLSEPGGLALAGDRLYIADTGNHAIRVLDLATGALSTLVLRGLDQPAAPADACPLPPPSAGQGAGGA